MISEFGIVAIAVLACMVTAAPHCSCPKVVRPVCGSDGRLYSNSCDARCNNVEISHPGRCLGVLVAKPRCTCDNRKKEICGSDGKTYRNDCILNCATQNNSRLSIAYYGPCNTIVSNDQPECTCAANHSPVCGSDGITYDNDCWLNCATQHDSRLSIVSSGFCQDSQSDSDNTDSNDQPECTCADNHSPVCGSDGVSYDNDCWLNCATQHNSRLSIVHSGFCKNSEENTDSTDSNNQPECKCADNHSPVCGSDGVSYDNDCWLNCATQHNSRLSIAHSGFCKNIDVDTDSIYSNNQPECTCADNHSPVCGSDGVTYNNDCWLNCATQYNSRLSIAHSGFCKGTYEDDNTDSNKQPECTCADNHSPVCGSDGVTYDNDCWLNCATQHNSRLSIVHSGFCADEVSEPDQNSCSCTRNFTPVCGTDGVTYNNECLLRCASKDKARDGACEARW